MKKKDLEKLKSLLLAEQQAIIKHLNQLEGASEQEIAHGSGDVADLASVEITQTALQKLGNREMKLLSKIDHALAKFETDQYGICEMCGEEIAYRRLEARPVAQYCIDCKTEMEQNERRYVDSEEEEVEIWGDAAEIIDKIDDSNA